MSKDNPQTPAEEIIPYLSFPSLRDTHRELLKQKREERKDSDATNEAFWPDVQEFLQRGEAAGAFLDDDEERLSSQNLLDYWHNQLYHAGLEGPEAILAEFDPTTQPEIPDKKGNCRVVLRGTTTQPSCPVLHHWPDWLAYSNRNLPQLKNGFLNKLICCGKVRIVYRSWSMNLTRCQR